MTPPSSGVGWMWVGWGLGVVLALTLAGCGESEPAATQAAGPPRAAAARQVKTLQQQFLNVISAGRDPRDLIGQGRQIVKAHPDFIPARQLFGQILLRSGQGAAAYAQFDQALSLDDRARPRLVQLAGSVALQLGRHEAALSHYREAVRLNPDQAKPRIGLAKVLIETNRPAPARDQLLRVLRRHSASHLAHGVLASLYRKQNESELARQHIRKAIDLLPEGKADQRAIYAARRASLLRGAKQWGQAITVLRDLPAEQQFKPHVLEEMALNWQRLGKPENAAAIYDRALQYLPHNEAIATAAARWAIKAGRHEQARDHLQALRRINPRSAALQRLRRRLRKVSDRAAREPTAG